MTHIASLRTLQTLELYWYFSKQVEPQNIRIKALSEYLNISQSPLEKRFRQLIGTSPKNSHLLSVLSTLLNVINLNAP